MKKLTIAALAAVAVGGAYAVQVADYKASVKYVNMQKKTLRIDGHSVKRSIKVVKSTTVKGYLIYDDCACNTAAGVIAARPAFLVVKSTVTSDGKAKIFPADLLVDFWNTTPTTKNWEAQGYLFAGMYNKAGLTTDVYDPAISQNPWMDKYYQFGDPDTEGTRLLFGPYNDANQRGAFVDSWMYHSGFGKAKSDTTESHCGDDIDGVCLQSLSGSVIGGLYICLANGLEEVAPCLWSANSTTDVITGTWSIKKTTKLDPIALTTAEITELGDDAELVVGLLPYVKAASAKTSNKGKDSGLATFGAKFREAFFKAGEKVEFPEDEEEEEEPGDGE